MANRLIKDLSVVVIGKNAQWSISRLLESVIAHAPSHLATEIIYVDSASTDLSIEIVSQYPVTIIQLSADQPLCASAGRYVGSQYATGKYVLFIDSDMELLDGWLENALKEFDAKPLVAVVTGIVLDTDPTLNPDEIPPVDYSFYRNPGVTDVDFAGNPAMFRLSVLSQVGNWNPYIISDEEPELCLRIRHAGYRVIRLEYPVTRHYTASQFAISTVMARRKRRLYLGQGQTIRYHLNSSLLIPYLIERGYGVTAAAVIFLAVASASLSWASMNALWLLGFLSLIGAFIVIDAIRTRSLQRPLFHLIHRAVILEGTIKGFLMHPCRPDEYPGKVTFFRRVDAVASLDVSSKEALDCGPECSSPPASLLGTQP